MKQHIERFVKYLLYEKNASPETIRSYRNDLELLQQFLTPPGEATMPLGELDHRVIREFVSWLYDRKMQKASVARKLADAPDGVAAAVVAVAVLLGVEVSPAPPEK